MSREQIRDTIFDKITDWTPFADAFDEKIAWERTDQLLAAILPQVTTVEEWEALPDGVIAVSSDGIVYIKDKTASSDMLISWLTEPLTVVWQP